MARPWIRLYTDVPNNPKVQRLPAALFKFWINAICIFGKSEGWPPIEDVAWMLKMTPKAVRSNIDALIEARLFESNSDYVTPHDWDDLQYESDTSRERQKAYRERHKKRNGDVTVTLQEQNRADTETEQTQTRAERADAPELYVEKFTAAICKLGFGNPDGNVEAAYFTAKVAEACEDSGATPELGAFVASNLLKNPRFHGKPVEYLTGALRRELVTNGQNSKAVRKADFRAVGV